VSLGEIYVNTVHQSEVVIRNVADIELTFSLAKNNTHQFASKFHFEPESGTLAVGEEKTIRVTFKPDSLGDFEVPFEFNLNRAASPLILTFKGKLLGPTFHFEEEELNFDFVSFGFVNQKALHLRNTSEIPMRYQFRITSQDYEAPQNSLAETTKEFAIEPPSGVLAPFRGTEIKVKFTSHNVQRYRRTFLVMDVECVGESVATVPIFAECVVPPVSLVSPKIHFGTTFLEHPYENTVTFLNDTELPATYELIPQDEMSRDTIAEYQLSANEGVIEGYNTTTLKFHFIPRRLGLIHLPMYFRIKGSNAPPLEVALSAHTIGPRVNLELPGKVAPSPTTTVNNLPSTAQISKNNINETIKQEFSLNFGRVPVLTRVEKKLKLNNDSLIPAVFQASVQGKTNVFQIQPDHGVISPNQSQVIYVVVSFFF
jgi:hydrocephalus-inducing protein